MLMLILGENDAIETNVFFLSVNARVNLTVNTDTRCEWTLNITLICIKVEFCLIYFRERGTRLAVVCQQSNIPKGTV